MLTVAGRGRESCCRVVREPRLLEGTPEIGESTAGPLVVDLLSGWYLVQELIPVELLTGGGGRAEAGVIVEVRARHLAWILGAIKSEEWSCLKRWINGVGEVRTKLPPILRGLNRSRSRDRALDLTNTPFLAMG